MDYSLTPVLVAVLTALVGYSFWSKRRPKNFPPGPPILPVIGSLASFDHPDTSPFHLTAKRFVKKYGPMFSINLGGSANIIVINKFSMMKKALVECGSSFASRPWYPYRMKHYNPNRIGIADGQYTNEWRSQRSTVMSILKTLGYGKCTTEQKIQQECKALISDFAQKDGEAFDPENYINISVANVIAFLLFGERFDHDDEELQKFLIVIQNYLLGFSKDTEGDWIPVLRLLPSHQRSYKLFINCCEAMEEFITKQINKRKKKITVTGEDDCKQDFIQLYLKELQNAKSGKSKVTEDWTYNLVLDFFVAGADTTNTTLNWALLYMMKYPKVQEKIQKELDSVLGTSHEDNPVSLSHRNDTPYTRATILEIQRISSIAVFALPHVTTEAVDFEGFHIPKGNEVWFNLYQVLHDQDLWGDPEEFRPERFMNDDGTDVVVPEYWVPFSLGRRSCAGEQLAKQELYLFFASMMRAFEFRVPNGSENPSLKAQPSDIIRHPYHYKLCAVPR